MNYLLLMYHPQTYWSTQSSERDEAEEHAFAEFCGWMREQGITWTSNALAPLEPDHRVRFSAVDAAAGMLPELTDVISGYFLLNIPSEKLIPELLNRVPRLWSTGIELRQIT